MTKLESAAQKYAEALAEFKKAGAHSDTCERGVIEAKRREEEAWDLRNRAAQLEIAALALLKVAAAELLR